MIKVLIVDDSVVNQKFLQHILSYDAEISIAGFASNGEEALEAVKKLRPDVISMDIHMPKVDGLEATRLIMKSVPTPIVIVSGSTSITEVESTFRATEAGALAAVLRPPNIDHPDHLPAAKELIETLKLMSEIKLVKRFPQRKTSFVTIPPSEKAGKISKELEIVAIGASTGGPQVIQSILKELPHSLHFPLLIVQHIATGFVGGFVEWLANSTKFPVQIAKHGESFLPGRAYVAPDALQMGVDYKNKINLSNHPPENGLCPSVSYLFRSVAENYGSKAMGILLTGMGRDGAEELKLMKEKGAITIAQDEESSVVHGMPGEAIKIGAASYILSPENIVSMILSMKKSD